MAIIKPADILVCDANILIDFIDSESEEILNLISKGNRIYVPLPIYSEVKQLTNNKISALDITIYTPELELLIQASTGLGQCSPQDTICLLICEKMNWICLTNDKNLRKQYNSRGIKTLWGMQLLLHLHNKGTITRDKALKCFHKIRKINTFITDTIESEFIRKLKH